MESPSEFVFALLNTAPTQQTVDVEFEDVFFDQVRTTVNGCYPVLYQ